MNETRQDASIDVESLDEQIDSIFHELQLALQWKRPSILFAIYNSKTIRKSAQDALEKLILESGQDVTHYQIEYDEKVNLTQFISEITRRQKSIFYIDPLNSEGKNSQIGHLISMLNSCKGYLIDHLTRVVFWLTEDEALNVAHHAPDFWASRHRVFEFIQPQMVDGTQPAEPVSAGQGKGELRPMSTTYTLNGEGMPGESALVFDLSDGDEPGISGINLLLMMGVANWKDGNHDKACETLLAALAIAEKSGNLAHQAMCHKAIALAEADSGKIEQAIQSYKKVVALEPKNISVWNNIGVLCLQTGKLDGALNAYNNAIKADPNDTVSWNGRGTVLANQGQLEEAISSYRKAIKLNANYITPWVKLADVLTVQNRHQDALYAYMRTVEMDNKNVHAWSEIGNIYFKAGSFEQAIDAYKKATMLGVDSEMVYTNLAHAYTSAGHYTEAIPLIQKVLERNGDDSVKAEMWNMLGDVYRRVDEYEKAVAAYEMADRFTTTVGEVTEALASQAGGSANVPGTIKALVNQVEQPARVTGQADSDPSPVAESARPGKPQTNPSSLAKPELAVEPENKPTRDQANANLWTRLGNTYMKAGAIDKAIEAFRKAVNLDPESEQSYAQLAEAYIHKSDLAEAVSVYRNRVDQLATAEEKAVTYGRIGDLCRKMKDFSGALEALETAIGLDPENASFLDGLEKIQNALDGVVTEDDAPVPAVKPVRKPAAPSASNPEIVMKTPVLETGTSVTKPENTNGSHLSQAAEALNVNLNSAIVWNELGNIFTRSRTFDEAINAYNKAIQLNPEFGWSYSNLALVFARQGKRDEAVSLYLKSIGLLWTEADKAVAWNRLGDVYRQEGKYPEAIEAYQNADRLSHGIYVVSANREVNFEQLFTYFVS